MHEWESAYYLLAAIRKAERPKAIAMLQIFPSTQRECECCIGKNLHVEGWTTSIRGAWLGVQRWVRTSKLLLADWFFTGAICFHSLLEEASSH